jgi:hypothetical protein
MKVKALCSFAGVITMAVGEVKEVYEDILNSTDLIRSGYVVVIEDQAKAKEKKENKADEGAGEDPAPAKPKRRTKK